MLRVGDKAPDFELKDQTGKAHKLSSYKGKGIVMYFYPKDLTPGCTIEACSFRDNYDAYKKKGIVVFGVSADTVDMHQRFAERFELPFPLLADTEKEVCKKYGVWGEKSFMGRKFMGINRITFFIGTDGKVKKVFKEITVKTHAQDILKEAKEL